MDIIEKFIKQVSEEAKNIEDHYVEKNKTEKIRNKPVFSPEQIESERDLKIYLQGIYHVYNMLVASYNKKQEISENMEIAGTDKRDRKYQLNTLTKTIKSDTEQV